MKAGGCLAVARARRNADPYFHSTYFFQDWLRGFQDVRNCTVAQWHNRYDKVSEFSCSTVPCLHGQIRCHFVLAAPNTSLDMSRKLTHLHPLPFCPQYSGIIGDYLQQQTASKYSSSAKRNKWVVPELERQSGLPQ